MVSGDTAVVGAVFDDHAAGTDAGSAYVFALGCGACCYQQSCTQTTNTQCAGVWRGTGTVCDPTPCIDACPDPCNATCANYNRCTCDPPSCAQPISLYEPGTEHCPPAAPNNSCACNLKAHNPKDDKDKSNRKDKDDKTDPVQLFSGEVYETAVDLRIPGRGMDFTWTRTYRSRVGPNTVQGNGWDFAHNIRVQVNGASRDLFDGNTRTDTYLLQPDGTWARSEFFRVLKKNPDNTYTLTFEDGGIWSFFAITGGVNDGKLSAVTDRNSNTTAYSYDGLGRLVTIHDTLDTVAHNRDITIAYNADGFVSSVTDWMGRQVTYAYYQNADAGGSFGDLKSVTTPAVIATPNGNDYPLGKTTTYTYSKGFADARQNHNLLTITDGKGQTYVTNTFAYTTNPADINFDHVTRQVWGNQGPGAPNTDTIDIVYVAQTPSAANNYAILKTIVNDRVGNVTEYFYDGQNRSVLLREYTGRAPDPDAPTTESLNRPAGQLRADDPSYFETLPSGTDL